MEESLKDVIDRDILQITPDVPVINAIELMHERESSCALIKDKAKDRLVGIITERDIVQMISLELDLREFTVGDMMTRDLITLDISQEVNIFEVSKLFSIHRIRHLPIVDGLHQRVVGLLTPTQIRNWMKPEYLLRYIKVNEAMVTQVIQGKPEDNLMVLSKRMSMARVSCVVIIDEQTYTPIGIVTEKDMVQYRCLGLDFHQVQAHKVMSSPLFTVSSSESLWQVNQKMVEMMVRRLVVVNPVGRLIGIVTQTQILKLLNPAEMHHVMQQMQEVIDQQTVNLQRLNHKLAQANSQLEKLASVDYLTQVANRQSFEDYIGKQWSRAVRSQECMAIMMVDVDHFKLYNDTYGHLQGDRCLTGIAQVLQDVVKRSSDLVARFGGEEFIIVLFGTNEEGAQVVAEEIILAIQAMKLIHQTSPTSDRITVSIGIASAIANRDLSLETLINTADEQLYQAKAKSRNTYCATTLAMECNYH